MARRQFDLVLGGHDADVTSVDGGSIGGSGVRVIVDDTNCRNKQDALQSLNYIANRMKEGTWPPDGFSPLQLFAAGEQGGWYDPSDLDSLFQDAAGTIPVTATGQPVGRMLDKSGRGNHASQGTAGSRPTFRDVGGLRYLEFDGVDDFLVTGNIDLTGTDKLSVFSGLRKASDATTAIFTEFSGDSSANAGTFAILAPPSNGAATIVVRSRGTALSSVTLASLTAPVTRVISLLADIAGDTVIGRSNGVAAATSVTDQGTGNYGNYPLYLGRRGGATLPFTGHLYGLIVRGVTSNAAAISNAESYLAAKTGVTLA